MKQVIVNNQVTNYMISETGCCYNTKTHDYLDGQILKNGYLSYNLTLPDGEKKRFYAHRLVAIAYIPNPESKEQVNHKDGNKENNNVSNLEWVTASENQLHSSRVLGKKNVSKVYQFSPSKELIKVYNNLAEVYENGYNNALVQQEYHNPTKTLTLGYYWNDSEDNNFPTKSYRNIGLAREVGQYDKNTFELLKVFPSTGEAARSLGVKNSSHIGECARGKIKSYKGYIWKYMDEIE